MFKRLALTAVLAVAATLLASVPANAGDPFHRTYTGTHSCCSGGMYLRSSAEGFLYATGDRIWGETEIDFRVRDRREDGLCGRVWIQAWSWWGNEIVDTTATDCDSNLSSSARAYGFTGVSRAAHFLYTVGRIRQRDGYIDYTRYGPHFIPGA